MEGVENPLVHLKLQSTPETLTLVRGVLGALSEVLAVDPELLDDMKTAISEACNNVVLHAYPDDVGPLQMFLGVTPDAIAAVICDDGVGMPAAADPEDGVHGVGLPLMKALADEVDFIAGEDGGTTVRLEFAAHREGRRLFLGPESIAGEDGWSDRLEGDAVVSLSPVRFVGPILGRLARALAARARFSLDRFSDVYLVTDALAVLATRSAAAERVGFSIATSARRLEIVLGPLREGSGNGLEAGQARDPSSALVLLSDRVASRPVPEGELLEIVMTDPPGS